MKKPNRLRDRPGDGISSRRLVSGIRKDFLHNFRVLAQDDLHVTNHSLISAKDTLALFFLERIGQVVCTKPGILDSCLMALDRIFHTREQFVRAGLSVSSTSTL